MIDYRPSAAKIRDDLTVKLSRYFGCTPAEATTEQMYKATAMTVRDILTEKRGDFKKQAIAFVIIAFVRVVRMDDIVTQLLQFAVVLALPLL
ncbi:MAG: hypothetical protein IJW70_07520, partial [Clostridia bacterium]|nr:hypothetical protein [Clostridia bacterium]